MVSDDLYSLLSAWRSTKMIRVNFVAVNYLYVKILTYLYYDDYDIISLTVNIYVLIHE